MESNKLTVLILAAGRGRRLKPLTDATPKPLLQIAGQTLIEHHLERLAEQGFEDIVINLSWLGEQIDTYLHKACYSLNIRYSNEPPDPLETGGGIVQALDLIVSDPFILINGDIWSDFNYADLSVSKAHDMHLVLVPNPPHHPNGDFSLENGQLHIRPANFAEYLTYAGIGCFRRRVFAGLTPTRFPLRPVLEQVITDQRASGEIYHGKWIDVGTIKRLTEARKLAD